MIELNFEQFINESVTYRNLEVGSNYGNHIGLEQKIRRAMYENLGWLTKDASSNDNGISCWIVSKDGGRTKIAQIPLHIETRKNFSGNDILWETIQPWTDEIGTTYQHLGNRTFNGNDMHCDAQLMVSVSNDGEYLRFRKVGEVLEIARQLGKGLIETYLSNGNKVYSNEHGRIRVKDKDQVTAIISSNSFNWKWDVKLEEPIAFS